MSEIRRIISFGSKFKLCTIETLDFANVDQRQQGPQPGFGGFQGKLFSTLVQGLGVNFDYYIPKVFGLGEHFENGTYIGCDDLLQRKEVDVAWRLNSYFLNSSEIGQSALANHYDSVNILIKIPGEAPKFDVFLKTFDWASFLAIGASLVLVTLIFYLLTKRKESYVAHLISRFAELVLQEPFVKIKMTLPLEVLSTFWMVGAHFITLFFNAVFLTALLITNSLPPLDNMNKLWKAVEAGEYKIVTLKNTPIPHFLKESIFEKERRLGNIILKNNWILDINKSNTLSILQNNTAIITTSFHKILLVPPDFPLVDFKETIYHSISFCAYTLRSFPLKDKFNKVMWKIIESGLHDKVIDHYVFKKRLATFKNLERGSESKVRPPVSC